MQNLIKILRAFAEDFFIFVGLTLIIAATFALNTLAGVYVLGFILLLIGVIMARNPPKRR